MQLALQALCSSALVDGTRIGALGYCFGGPAVLDLARANPEALRAAITFHGDCSGGHCSARPRSLLFHPERSVATPAALKALRPSVLPCKRVFCGVALLNYVVTAGAPPSFT